MYSDVGVEGCPLKKSICLCKYVVKKMKDILICLDTLVGVRCACALEYKILERGYKLA